MHLGGLRRSLSLAIVWSTIFGHAALFESFVDLPKDVIYDFVIVGGGTAGNVLARYLVEDETVNVLVLEAGPSNFGVLETEVPFLASTIQLKGPYNWNYTTTPQVALGNRVLDVVRGYILGGSSSVNWCTYTRGTAEDWDRFASTTGDEGWGWKSMLNYFKKSERWSKPADNHNITGQFNPAVHGYDGKIGVSLAGYPRSVDSMIMNASHALGGPFSFNLDVNSGYPLGVGYQQSTISGGQRSSSATGYLQPILDRQNIQVLLHARVSRLLKTTATKHNHAPAFRGVEFKDSTGTIRTVFAKREVILSAGTINTPQILMNSGIGNSQDLLAVGVHPVVHLPGVGANLYEHPYVTINWMVNDNHTHETLRRNPAPALKEWKANKTGPFTNPITGNLMLGRLPFELPARLDPAAGPNTPHFEIATSNGLSRPILPPTGNFFSTYAATMTTASRGSVKLASSDPFAPPLFDPGLYTDPNGIDLLIMREAIRYLQKFLKAHSFDGYFISPPDGFKDNMTDEELNIFIKNNTGMFSHPMGTTGMSPKGAEWGVTEPDLTVKGLAGVRIVDASVMPYPVAGHTVAPVYAIAERGADIIKAAHGLNPDRVQGSSKFWVNDYISPLRAYPETS